MISTPRPCLLDLDALGRKHRDHGRPFPRAWPGMASAREGVQVSRDRAPALKAGAIGGHRRKVSEAEVMAAAGIDDILIAHLVVGPSKRRDWPPSSVTPMSR